MVQDCLMQLRTTPLARVSCLVRAAVTVVKG